ncbi:MAG: cytochrome c family protein [Sphingomonadales bacterium]|nr:cytochrome c family protein [Sphingomonadales bacterium]
MRYSIFLIFYFILSYSPAMAQVNNVSAPVQVAEANGDADKGRTVFFRCRACHSISQNQNGTKVGPNLFGIFGKPVGSVATYENYSKALRDANFIWDEQQLDNWLKNPNGFLPGNTMAFSGVMRQSDRDDLIAFIRQQKAAE